ncbi:hypothetical protein FOXG_14040 [Fusarium oxysporum f. sp. lycopersici 4287]|uniref:PD-(D/E)XK nuclease-like domain-containing protein n=2 Tax=Fusarium oxysporum TaxID=5507 RepID=A0A0J9WT72_FUSO4|nr:hypothetical protein FOXG_12499 [Fusarium oxysporum f. sp. lycopersici 4287]XP_018253572.1 hypothetical protein FOXG_14040 [Fusarium oxysporum f. sp. lycopersici 4287]KNB13834.1 hypothetical protein FOXG_12499 [Fusarium oxysporum f. sp. lycopersici 4287]KNB15527.1 hypothetical protein FOXG_14040 [Fusarium oxysporum f. sp. lycopersici 4287]
MSKRISNNTIPKFNAHVISMNDLHHSRFIEDWFDGIIPNPELTKPNNRLPQPRAVVTKRRHSMTTPPPSNSGSHNQRASSPTKRQRLDYTNGYGSDTGDVPEGARVEEMEMGEETPRSNINQARPHLPPIPFRGFDVPGITPSRSNSMASGSSCQSPSVAGSEKSSARASQQSATEDETSFPRSRKPKSALEVALHELDFLRDIVNTAQDCKDYTRAEVSWNIQVHQPLLQHSLAGHATVQVEPSLTARILSPFSAATSGRGGGNVIENKMIDFCLTLWLNDGKPHRLLDERNAKAVAADLKLISAIADKVWSQPPDAQSVNQTGYPPLQFAPIACNIETKTSSVQQDGELQLSVWTAAWYQRMNMNYTGRAERSIRLPQLR